MMGRYKRYSKELKIKVAKEAALPEHERCEHIIADKYGVMPWTVEKWRALYLEYGEMGLPSKCKPGLKFPFIYIHRYEHRVARIAKVLTVSERGYYKRVKNVCAPLTEEEYEQADDR